jgi:hypothetical protein
MELQIAVTVMQSGALFLAYYARTDLRRYAALCGLAAQPLWVWMLWSNGLKIVMFIGPVYAFFYARAAWQHWSAHIREQEASKEKEDCGDIRSICKST